MSQPKDEASEDKMLCQGRYGMLRLSQRTDFIGGDGTTKRDVSVKSQLIKKLAGAAKNDTTD